MLRALSCVLVFLLLLAASPARWALAQEAPPLEADGVSPVAPKPASPRPVSGKAVAPGPGSGKSLASKPGPTGVAVAKAKARGPAVKNDGKRYLRSRDENHDGRISREEFLAGTSKRFAKMDLNGDGIISAQEAAAAKAKRLERKAKSEARRQAQGKPQSRKIARQGKGDRPAKPYLSAVDANQDGRVSRQEYLAKRERKFVELDLNRDRVISREEAKAAKAKLLKRRAERKAAAQNRASGRKAGKTARPVVEPGATASAQAPQNP